MLSIMLSIMAEVEAPSTPTTGSRCGSSVAEVANILTS